MGGRRKESEWKAEQHQTLHNAVLEEDLECLPTLSVPWEGDGDVRDLGSEF